MIEKNYNSQSRNKKKAKKLLQKTLCHQTKKQIIKIIQIPKSNQKKTEKLNRSILSK